MNKELFSKHFNELKPYILNRWNKLTSSDLEQINSRFDLFLSRIQEKYNISREDVEEQIQHWKPNINFSNENREAYKAKHEVEHHEGSSIGKWLVLAGLPLLFLLGYLGTHFNAPADKTIPLTTTSANQTLYTKQSQEINLDNTISENVRKVLFSNSLLLNDLKDLRIETKDGVVIISGRVRNEEEKILVNNLIEKLPGIVKVDNKIEVIK